MRRSRVLFFDHLDCPAEGGEVSASLMLSLPFRQYWRLARCCTWFLFSFLSTQIHRKQVSHCMCFFPIQANHDDETGSAPSVFSFRSDFNSSSAGKQMSLKMYVFSLHLPPAANLITNTTFTPYCDCGMRYPRPCDMQLEFLYPSSIFIPNIC